uniref:Uncharacterized protein n=1 Tax=Globodera rostochiensis TaxID=31243 RepID=A0A914HUP3_GLORO
MGSIGYEPTPVDEHEHQRDDAGAASSYNSANGTNLWQICPFLFEASSSPGGESVRCTECGDSEQFNDLGSAYNHLKKRHPQQFQQLYEQWKREPPPKRRPHMTKQQNAKRNGENARVSVNIELQETAFVDPSTFICGQQQNCSENEPKQGPSSAGVWCVGLFERHHFRNGTVGALCLECGQMLWELDTDVELMEHIVDKHPEYMPNLTPNVPSSTGQQNVPTYIDEQGELWQCLDIANNGESAEEMFHRHGARPLQQQQLGAPFGLDNAEKFLLCCAFDASLSCCFRAIWIGHQRAIFQSLGHNHPIISETSPINAGSTSTSSSESVMETIERVLQQDHSTFVDAGGKEWHWLADVSASGGEAELRRACRAHDLYREGGARNFSCKWSSRNARSSFNCPLRGLYVPARNALFYRQNHNHSLPVTAPPKNNEVPTSSTNSIFVDRKGKEWQWLAEISIKGDLDNVCRANGLIQNGPRNVVGKAYFGCQQAKISKIKSADNKPCPYRALYVNKRRAIFHRLAHNHQQKVK